MNVKARQGPDRLLSFPACPSPGVLGGVRFLPLLTMGIDRFRVSLSARQGAVIGNKSEAA